MINGRTGNALVTSKVDAAFASQLNREEGAVVIAMGPRILTLAVTLVLVSITAAVPASAESSPRQPCVWQLRPGVTLPCHNFAYNPGDRENIWGEYRTLFATVRALMRETAQRVATDPKPNDEREAIRRGIDAEVERIISETQEKIVESARNRPASAERPGCIMERRQQNGLTQTLVQCSNLQSSVTTSTEGTVHTHSAISISSTSSSSSR